MAGMAAMAGTGLITSLLAPALILLTADSPLWRRVRLPAPLALTVFLALHAAITAGMMFRLPAVAMALAKPLLLAGATLFWLPVLGPGCLRLSGPGRSLYLFIAAPGLDLAALYVIARGDTAGGLAMITAMLPVGVAAMLITWQWVTDEERAACIAEGGARGSPPGSPATGPGSPATDPGAPAAAPLPSRPLLPGSRPLLPGSRPLLSGFAGRRTAGGLPSTTPARERVITPLVTQARWITRKGVRLALACLWLSAAALQAQPFMFTEGLARQVVAPAAAGQPAGAAALIRLAGAIIAAHPVVANSAFVAIQMFIGGALLMDRTARAALTGSVVWALAVWGVGEGFGGLLTGMGGVLTGSPGAALLYGLLAVIAMPARGESGKGAPPPHWVPAAWATVWLVLLLTGPWPQQTPGSVLSRELTGQVPGLPAVLVRAVTTVSAVTAHDPLPVVLALATGQAFIALGALRPGMTRDIAATFGAVIAVLAWVSGQALGGITGGQATDIGAGPPLVLLALAVWAASPRPAPASMCVTVIGHARTAGSAGKVWNEQPGRQPAPAGAPVTGTQQAGPATARASETATPTARSSETAMPTARASETATPTGQRNGNADGTVQASAHAGEAHPAGHT